ncbi:hypothetical protein TA3x_004280 [Tundrisphaera sp. TA3]|uniref:hypothetical protein n=1 Tax=Tundrisphaera sp. TA3 TaxID=3435775 RepID=UPI003EBA2ED3
MAGQNDELFNIILKIQGQADVDNAVKKLEEAERELQDVVSAAALLGQSVPTAELAKFAQNVATMKGRLAEAESNLARFGAAERKAAADAVAAANQVAEAEAKKAAAATAAAHAAESAADRAAAATVMQAAAEEASATKQIAARARVQAALRDAIDNPTKSGIGATLVSSTTGNQAQKIVMQVQGIEKVQLLNQAIQQETANINALNAQLQRGSISQAAFGASAGRSAMNIAAAQREIKAIGSSTGISAYKMQQFAGTLDDLQYVGEMGLRPIINNLMQIAPVAGIAALGVDLLWRHWGSLMRLMDVGMPQPALEGPELLAANLKKATEEMEELMKKTSLTWVEIQKLQKLQADVKEMKQQEKDESEVQGMLDGQSEREREVGGGVKKALDEAGGKNALDELIGNLAENKDAKGNVFNTVNRKMTSPEQAAKDLIRTAGNGDEASRAEILANLKPGSNFAKQLNANSPETKLAKDREEARDAAEEEEQKEKDQRYEKRKDRDKKQAKDIANDILKGKNANKMLDGDVSDDDIKKELAARGLRTDDPTLLKRVKGATEARANELGADQSTKEGLGSLDAGKKSLMDENNKKAADDRKKELDKKVDAAEKANPGIADLFKNSIKGAMQIDGTPLRDAQNDLLYKFADQLGPDVARSLIADAGGKAQEEMISDYTGEKVAQSENATIINGASALRDSIQGSVKSPEVDELRKLHQETVRSNEFLAEIARKGGGLA